MTICDMRAGWWIARCWSWQVLLRRDAARRLRVDLGETFREAFALGVDEGCGPGARDRIDRVLERDVAGKRRTDHMLLDHPIVAAAALVVVALALDEAGAFGDFGREARRDLRGLDDEGEPGFDRALLLLISVGPGPPRLELGEEPQPQEARDRLAVELHRALEGPAAQL